MCLLVRGAGNVTRGMRCQVVDWLVQVGEPPVKINATNKHGFTPLNAAATGGYQRVVTRLLALPGVNVNKPTYSDNSPLLMACMQEHDGLVRLLLVSASASGSRSSFVCMVSVSYRECSMSVEQEEPRADIVPRPTNWRSSALHAACIGGDVGIIRMLLADDRVDVNACTPADHVSPFFHACACGKLVRPHFVGPLPFAQAAVSVTWVRRRVWSRPPSSIWRNTLMPTSTSPTKTA